VKRAVVIGMMILAVLALPVTAHSDTAKDIVQGAAAGVITGILCSAIALSDDEEIDPEDFARRGWQIGVAGTYAFETFENDAEKKFKSDFRLPATASVDNSFGFNGRVGYRCHERFSAEVHVEWLDGFDVEASSAGFGDIADYKAEPIVVTANAKGYLLTGRYQPFLLVGGGVMTADLNLEDNYSLFPISRTESETAFTMRFGGGIDLYATKNAVVSLDATYVLPFGNLDDLDYISVGWGFQYRF
jgi:opacity protein-like surface antigen